MCRLYTWFQFESSTRTLEKIGSNGKRRTPLDRREGAITRQLKENAIKVRNEILKEARDSGCY